MVTTLVGGIPIPAIMPLPSIAPTAVAAVDDWHPGMPVQRGAARARLDMAHGFLAGIVRNQRDRDAYEQAWQKAQAASGDDYQRKWGRAPVQRDGRDWNQ